MISLLSKNSNLVHTRSDERKSIVRKIVAYISIRVYVIYMFRVSEGKPNIECFDHMLRVVSRDREQGELTFYIDFY